MPEEKDEFGGVAIAEPEKDEFGGEALEPSPAVLAATAVKVPQAVLSTTQNLFKLGAPGSEMARQAEAESKALEAETESYASPFGLFKLFKPAVKVPAAIIRGGVEGANLVARNLRDLASEAVSGKPFEPEPIFGEKPEETEIRRKYPLGAPGVPLYQPQTDTPSDVQRLISGFSTPEAILQLPLGATRLGGKILLASMLPDVAEQVQAIASSEGSSEDKMDRIRGLVVPALVGLLSTRPDIKLPKLPGRFGTVEPPPVPVEPVPGRPITGRALPGLPEGAPSPNIPPVPTEPVPPREAFPPGPAPAYPPNQQWAYRSDVPPGPAPREPVPPREAFPPGPAPTEPVPPREAFPPGPAPTAPVPPRPAEPTTAIPAPETPITTPGAAPAGKPEVAELAPDAPGKSRNKLGDPLGTTYHATPEDWAAWQELQKLTPKERFQPDNFQRQESLKNKYGGMPPAAPKAAEAAPAVTGSPDDLVPALKPKEGEVIKGQKGNVHDDIYKAQGDIEGKMLRVEQPEHGFWNNKLNKFQTRDEAAAYLGEKDPLHSEHLLELQKAKAPKPSDTTPAMESGPMPDWVRERMQQMGLKPGRVFNDVDLTNPSVIEAIKSDPTLTDAQKDSLLKTGSLPEPAEPATIEETPIAGKTLADWEKVTDVGGLPPKGPKRAELAKWLAVPDQPQRIIQALANKKRTREIHAPPATIEEVTPPAETKPPVTETKPPVSETKPAAAATPAAAPAKETPADQAKPPAGSTTGKQQKKYLVGELNKALADAPDGEVEQGRAGSKYESDEAQRERLKENAAILERNKQKFGTVTIEVPGDGVFTVLNVKSALRDLQEKAKSFPVTATRAPAKKGTPSGEPTAPSAVGEGSPEDITSALDAFTSQETDETKPALGYAYSDGKQTVATDGRHMVIIKGALAGGTAKNPKVTSTDGKFVPEGVKAPNYQQVINTVRAESEPWFKGIDTARLFNLLKQAQGAMGNRDLSVQFWRNTDGSLGLKSGGGDVGEYEHNIKEGAKPLAAFNPQYVMDALHAARKMGSEKIDILGKDALSGALFKGKGVEAIVMPMRIEGPPQTEVTKPPAPEGGIKPGEGVGPGAAARSEFTARENRRRLLSDFVERLFGTRAAESFDALTRKAAGEAVPKTMARSGESGNAMVRFAASSTAAPYIAHSLTLEVLGDRAGDAAFRDRLGAVLVEDRLRAIYDGLLRAGKPDEAANVNTLVGPGGSFRNEGEFQAALRDPEIVAAIERHKQTIQPEAERFHTEAEGQLAGPGVHTGAFVNLAALFEDTPAAIFRGAGKGDYTRPFKRKSVFSRQAKGTAEKYETDYGKLAERMIRGNYEEYTKRQLYDQLQQDNLAVVLPPGAPRPTFDGKPAVKFQIKRQVLVNQAGGEARVIPQYENLWVDPAIASELRQAENIDGPIRQVALARFANVLNRLQLAGPTDAVWHTANMIGRIASSQGGKTALTDIARKIPLANVVDAVVRVANEAKNILGNDPETMRRIAELAEIGQIRPNRPETGFTGKFINLVDKAGRLVRDKMYENLSQRKNIFGKPLIEPSEAGRREWAGQLGQYNPRLMGQIESFFKEAGLSPFIVAGRNFNRAAMRQVTLSPGVRAANLASAIQMRAIEGLGVVTTLAAVPMAINYFTTGSPFGRKGVPFGAIDTGRSTKDGHYITIDPAQWVGLRRGMRLTGANALIEGIRRGELPSEIMRRAGTDIASSIIHPWAGPVVQAGTIARTGYTTSGFKESKDPHNYWQNFLGAMRNINPILHGWFQRQGGLGIPSAASSLAGAVGIKGASPYTAGQEIYNLAQKWKSDSDSPKLHKEVERRLQEDFGPSDYRDLRSALARDDLPKAREEYETLLKTKTPAEIVRTLEHPHPFTGSRANEVKFRASLTDEERELYQKALEERRAIFSKFREMQSTYRE